MFERPLRVGTRDFRTLISLVSSGGNEEFIKKLSEDVRDDDRFSLHYATDADDRVATLGLLVSYASHIKADVIVRINCHEPIPQFKPDASEARKPIVKVRAHELKEVSCLCGEMASAVAFPGDEEAEVTVIAREIQKRIADSVSMDSVLLSLRDASVGRVELNERLRELRGYLKKRTFFVSIELFPKKEEDVEKRVRQCSELIRKLHEYYSRKNAVVQYSTQLVLR